MFADALFSIRSELNERLDNSERKEGDLFEACVRNSLSKLKYNKDIDLSVFSSYERWLNDKEYRYGFSMPDKDDDEGL